MSIRAKCALAGIAATLLLAFTVSSSTANRLSLSNRNFRIVWSFLQFFDTNGEPTTECPVTMEGSFHSATIVKRRESLIGFITKAITNEGMCTRGPSHFVLTSLPWHVTYQSFSGILPRITSVRVLVRGIAYENVINSIACTFTENGVESISGEFILEGNGVIAGFEFDPRTRIARSAGALCLVPEAGLKDTGEVYLLGTTNFITVRLI